MEKYDGGPAFPCEVNGVGSPRGFGGMTLRDYFAAKVMAGMMATPDDRRYGDRADKALSVEEWQAWCANGMAEHAYRIADAMLAERSKN